MSTDTDASCSGNLSREKLKTLIVDDHPASILLLQEMLTGLCECFVATSGQQALDLFERAFNEGKPFEIVLLDINMPGMSGIELLKELRSKEAAWLHDPDLLFRKIDPRRRKYARIIMQTASENPQDFFDAYLQGKCNGYINKPFDKKELISKIIT